MYHQAAAEEFSGVAICTGTTVDTATTTSDSTVRTRCLTYNLTGGFLNLTFTGSSGNFKGTGNSLNNTVTGGAGDDILSGGSGNDTLITGSSGASVGDKLTGGSGSDIFTISVGNSFSVITDFVPGTDKIDVSAMGFTTLAQLQSAAVQTSASVVTVTSTLSGSTMKLRLNQLTIAQLSNALDFIFAPSGVDVTPPTLSNFGPTGTLAAGTSNATLTVSTNEAATCKYSTTAGDDFAVQTSFQTTGSVSHTNSVPVANATSYVYYIKCQDAAGNTSTEGQVSFVVAAVSSDTTPPNLWGLTPTGTLPSGTVSATLAVVTDESASCVYSATANTSFSSATAFQTTGGTSHQTAVLTTDGASYSYYVKCQDGTGNISSESNISFSVAIPGGVSECAGTLANGGATCIVGNNVTTSLATYTLSGAQINLAYSGTSTFKGTGNGAANTITGGPGDDTLLGGLGNDTLITGASGASVGDKLTGGAGSNLFVISPTNSFTIVVDFVPGTDKIDVSAMGFTSLSELKAAAVQTTSSQVTITATTPAGKLMKIKLNSMSAALFATVSAADFVFVPSGADITPPIIFDLGPVGTLATGTASAVLVATTSEASVCRYAMTPGVAFGSQTPFTATGSTTHSVAVSVVDGGRYVQYVKCQDATGNTSFEHGFYFTVAGGVDTGIHKIKHVVIIMQENRSFDEYFGTFPGANGIPMDANGVPTVCSPDPFNGGCTKPYHETRDRNVGGPHGTPSSIADINGGLMNGFISEAQRVFATTTTDVMGYIDDREIPNYWAYARNFVLHDNMFAQVNSWSAPAHLFMVSGWSATCATGKGPMSCVPGQPSYEGDLQNNLIVQCRHSEDAECAEAVDKLGLSAALATYLKSQIDAECQVDDPLEDCKEAYHSLGLPTAVQTRLDELATLSQKFDFAWTDLTHILYKNGVSWKYYLFEGDQPDCVDPDDVYCPGVVQKTSTPGFWNPLPSFETVNDNHQMSNIVPIGQFTVDARRGTLPAVSWVIPNALVSEHPNATVSAGQAYVTGLINTVMQGPNWDSTAIFVSWDDWGGFYDHVVPPSLPTQDGYGIRVPSFVVSPYAKQGYIDHQVLSHDAYLKFIEDAFLGGLRIDPLTDGRPDSRPSVRENVSILGDLVNDFDFNQQPRGTLILPGGVVY
ncbi:MAG TPA: alkaline phosphatase family protein [Candidatus Paceibacterota bacterium]